MRGAWASLGAVERRATLIAAIAGIAVRCLAPVRLVMIYKGYALTTAAADLDSVPRYGAGALVLHRAVLGTFGVDHLNLIALHTVLGVLGMVALVALLARFKPRPGAVAAAAWLLALTPLLIKDHRTESLLVVSCAALWPACLLWDAWLVTRRRWDLVGAVALLALAAMTRPELLAVVPILAGALVGVRGRPVIVRDRLLLLVAVGVFGLLVLPHALHIVAATQEQAASGALPAMEADLLQRMARGGVLYGAIFEPTLFPVAATALAVLALLLRPPDGGLDRRLAVALMVIAWLWMVVVRVDMPETSIPRLHAPAAALTCLAAGIGAAALLHQPKWIGPPAMRWRPWLLAIGLLATAAPTVTPLWQTTNEDEEEQFLRQVFDRLPAESVCLLRLDADDAPPPGKVHRDFPDYLAVPPMRNNRLWGLRAWRDAGQPSCPGGVYLVHGMRCYARADGQRADGGPKKRDDTGPIEACAETLADNSLRGARWQPVFEHHAPNHGDNEFGYYPDDPTFKLGLYQLVAGPGDDGRQATESANPQK